jgi:CRP-like cAMP-binding protein|tara:strand:+ start:19451 stop:20185 length:735 start_codon:yes stop_codon:yes gene_type:complete
MTNALIKKLGNFSKLSKEDEKAIQRLCTNIVRKKAGEDLIREGERPGSVHLLLDGWAFRYKHLPDGGRQILAYLIPGDICDMHIFVLRQMDHSIGLLNDAVIGLLSEDAMLELLSRHPAVERALWWATLVDEAVLREWLANIGRRDPYRRIAHLLCEMWVRMSTIGLVSGQDSFSLPLTQAELGDTVGLTPVTVNRVIQELRSDDLIILKEKRLTVRDVSRLMKVSEFDVSYLHLGNADITRAE